MKKNLVIIGILIAAIVCAWVFFGNPQYKKFIEKGREIERYRLQAYWDSINYLNIQKKYEESVDKNNTLESENNAIKEALNSTKEYYHKKLNELHELSGKELDSIYRLYAKDTIEAVEKFISLDECNETIGYLNKEILNMESIHTNDKKLIEDLMKTIEDDRGNTIALRNENSELKERLEVSDAKLGRRTNQRNIVLGVFIIYVIAQLSLN